MTQVLSPGLIQQVSDVGILICISVIFIVFVVKILDFLVSQAKTISGSIAPKLSNIMKVLSSMRSDIVSSITSHNTNSNNNFITIIHKIDELKNNVDKLQKDLDENARQQDSRINDITRNGQRSVVVDELLRQGLITREQLVKIIQDLEHTKK